MRRSGLAAVVAAGVFAAGCGDPKVPPPATDPDSVQQAEQQLKEEAGKERKKGKPVHNPADDD